MIYVLFVQVSTFLTLGGYFLTQGSWRLGLSQILLAAVQGIIYGGGF